MKAYILIAVLLAVPGVAGQTAQQMAFSTLGIFFGSGR
jgi:hypothetical protein